MKLFILLVIMITPTISFAGGHAEGGGDYTKTLLRETRVKIEEAKAHAVLLLKEITPLMLIEEGATEESAAFYKNIQSKLADEILQSGNQFIEGAERIQFQFPDGEKTVVTEHRSQAPLRWNLERCAELKITFRGAVALYWRDGGRHLFEKSDQEEEQAFLQRVSPFLDQLEELAIRADRIFERKELGHRAGVQNDAQSTLGYENTLESRGLVLTHAGRFLLSLGLVDKFGGPPAKAAIPMFLVGGVLVSSGMLHGNDRVYRLGLENGARLSKWVPPWEDSRVLKIGENALSTTAEGRLFLVQRARVRILLQAGGVFIVCLPVIMNSVATAKAPSPFKQGGEEETKVGLIQDLIRQYNEKLYTLFEAPQNLVIQREVLCLSILQSRAALLELQEEGIEDEAIEVDLQKELCGLEERYAAIHQAVGALTLTEQVAMSEESERIEKNLKDNGTFDSLGTQLASIFSKGNI